MPESIATVKVAHIGEDYATIEIFISRPGHPGSIHELETYKDLGEELQRAGLSTIDEK